MSPEEIKSIVEAALDQKQTFDWRLISLIILIILINCGVTFIVSYLTKKGENTAIRQDMGSITTMVESIRAEMIRLTKVEESKFHLKYEACLEALSLIDANLSHSLTGTEGQIPKKQYSTTKNARRCHSKLILSCNDTKILKLFGEIMFGPKEGQEPQKPPTDMLNDFRNLIRQELGFGQNLELDRERAWFGKVNFEQEIE